MVILFDDTHKSGHGDDNNVANDGVSEKIKSKQDFDMHQDLLLFRDCVCDQKHRHICSTVTIIIFLFLFVYLFIANVDLHILPQFLNKTKKKHMIKFACKLVSTPMVQKHTLFKHTLNCTYYLQFFRLWQKIK